MGGLVRSLALAAALLATGAGCSCSGDARDGSGRAASSATNTAEPRVRAADQAPAAADAAAQAAAAARPRHALAGSVRTYDGRALAGAIVRAEPVAVFPHAPDPRSPSETTAGADGAFALPSLEAGDWALLVSAEGALRTYAATVRVPERARFDIVLPRGSVIEGTVIDEATRAPVPGARVRLRGETDRSIGDARTSADGRFAMAMFEQPRGHSWRIDADGCATAPAESSSAGVDATVLGRHEVTLVAQRGRALTGRVVGPDGPIAGARVRVRPGGSDDPEEVREATTDAAGRYEVPRLAPDADSLWITAEAAGFVQEGERDPDVSAGDPPTGDNVDPQKSAWTAPDVRMSKRVPIGRCTIAGVVVDEEEHPVAGVALVTHHKVDAARATSEADGSFVLAEVPAEAKDEQVAIRCAEDGDWEGEASVETTAGASVRDVRIYVRRIERQRVRGRVLALDRTPVAGAHVIGVVGDVIRTHCFAPIDASWVHGFESRTAADGTFDVELRFRGSDFALIVESTGFALWVREIPLSDAVEKPVEVVLEAPATFSGRAVRRGTDVGVGGLAVSLFSGPNALFTDSRETFPETRVVGTTSADGSFRVEGLRATDLLQVGGPGWIDARVELDEDSPTDPLRVEMDPARELAGLARFADGRPCTGVDVKFRENAPPEFPQCEMELPIGDRRAEPSIRAGDDGSFRCGQLAADRYWLEFSGGSPQVIRRVAGPFDAGTRDVVVDLVRGATIRGRVVRPDGSPAKDVAVTAASPFRDRPYGRTTTGRDGAFAVGGLDAGAYTVTVAADGYLTWTKAGVRASDEPLDVRLNAGLAVAGVICDSSGDAVMFMEIGVEPVEAVMPAEERKGRTDADGRFRITALTKGRWRIRFLQDGFVERFDEVVVDAGSEALELRTSPRPPKPPAEEPPAEDGR